MEQNSLAALRVCVCTGLHEGTMTKLQTIRDISVFCFFKSCFSHKIALHPVVYRARLGDGGCGEIEWGVGGEGPDDATSRVLFNHLSQCPARHSFRDRSLMYGFKVFHREVMLKVVLITLLTAEPYGFPS